MNPYVYDVLTALPAMAIGALLLSLYVAHVENKSPRAEHEKKRNDFFWAYLRSRNDTRSLNGAKDAVTRWLEECERSINAKPSVAKKQQWMTAKHETEAILSLFNDRIGELEDADNE